MKVPAIMGFFLRLFALIRIITSVIVIKKAMWHF